MVENNKEQIFKAIEQISLQNPLSKEETKEIIINAVIKGFHSKYDPDANLELVIDEEKRIFQLFNNSKLVVKDKDFVNNDEYSAIELPFKKAKKINPDVKEGDFVREEVDFSLYSSSIMQQIKQIFTQTIREKKKEIVYTKHKSLKGEMIDVTVTSIGPTFVIFQLKDGTSAFMPANFRNPNIPLNVGKNTKVYVEDVLEDSKDAQIIVSNGSKQLIKRVLEIEIPEIASGIVEIVSISRQPGIRSKVAVKSNDVDIDPVGTIIGAGGNRIKAIINKLDGEKLDVILYSDNHNVFVANSLSPAKVASVVEKYDNDDNVIENQKIVIVPNNQLTLAIGKKGNNARLAVELTNVRIDVVSIDQAKERDLDIVYNVGLSEQEIKDIDAGIKINNYFFQRRSHTPNQINNNEFDNSIASFKESIIEEKTTKTNFNIDNVLFSDEQLKEMEAAFESENDSEDFANNNLDEDFEF